MRIYKDAAGNVLAQGVPFDLDGATFPPNWLDLATNDDLQARGIVATDEPDPQPVIAEPPPEKSPVEKLAALLGVSVDDLKQSLADS